ncbi:hypothetical protein MMC26_004725 [Xylographa opegraphella]|nr:hypothetical protein [Xylographa opegraphella]
MSVSEDDTNIIQDLSDQVSHTSLQTDDGQVQTEPETICPLIPSAFEIHMSFLGHHPFADHQHHRQQQEVKTTPLFSGPVLHQFGQISLPQHGLLAKRLPQDRSQETDLLQDVGFEAETVEIISDPRVFLNVNTPWSAFVCGSQGSGKSHTLSCMLESCLLQSPVSELPNPLAGLVFHYDNFSSYTSSQICEAAYLCSSGIPVKVLVSPTNFWRMKAAYENMPGLQAGARRPEVIPLRFSEQNLDVSRMMVMMAVKEKDGPVPLYIEVIHRILRQMAIESEGAKGLDYRKFRSRLGLEGLSRDQNGPLKLRLDLLESFMDEPCRPASIYTPPQRPVFVDTKAGRKSEREWEAQQQYNRMRFHQAQLEREKARLEIKAKTWSFIPGSMTIVDLSCPFVDDSAACALFTICLELFLENRGDVGRVVALDEAHKFMTGTDAASTFTESLLQVIRQQRHLATRIIIATQEPTISPKLLDLSTMTIVHRFTSPDWVTVLRKHLAGVSGLDGEAGRDVRTILKQIVQLEVGEALLFSPTAMVDLVRHGSSSAPEGKSVIEKLGMAYLKIRVRKRLTADGGKSIMAV